MELGHLLDVPPGRKATVIRSLHPAARQRLLDQALQRTIDEQRSDPRTVRALAQAAADLAECAGDDAAATRARLELSNAHRRLSRHLEALSILRAVEPAVRRAGRPEDVTRFLAYRASLALDRNDWRGALAALAAAMQSSPRSMRAVVWTKWGMAYQQAGELEEARNAHWRALRLADDLDDAVTANCAAHNIAGLLNKAGDPEAAAALVERLTPLNDLVGNESDRLKADWLLAQTMAAGGDLDAACERIRELALSTLADPRLPPKLGLSMGFDAVALASDGGSLSDPVAVLAAVLHAAAARELPERFRRLASVARLVTARDLPSLLARLRRAIGDT